MLMKNLIKIMIPIGLLAGLAFTSSALADPTYVLLSSVSQSVDNTVSNLATVLVDVAIIAGIGFIIAAFFKFHQHKQNPQQVQMSQGISLLLIGCGLTLIPLLIPTASVSVLGSKAASNTAQIGGKSIQDLVNTDGKGGDFGPV